MELYPSGVTPFPAVASASLSELPSVVGDFTFPPVGRSVVRQRGRLSAEIQSWLAGFSAAEFSEGEAEPEVPSPQQDSTDSCELQVPS